MGIFVVAKGRRCSREAVISWMDGDGYLRGTYQRERPVDGDDADGQRREKSSAFWLGVRVQGVSARARAWWGRVF